MYMVKQSKSASIAQTQYHLLHILYTGRIGVDRKQLFESAHCQAADFLSQNGLSTSCTVVFLIQTIDPIFQVEINERVIY